MGIFGIIGKKGQTTILLVSVLSIIGSIFILTSADIFKRDYTFKTRDFDQVLLNEATISSFAVMEAALARRLWDPPPDNQCLKAENFETEGSFPNGLTWKVTATYNYSTKNYELLARGEYAGLKAVFKKRIKVLDVSDYLLFSGNNQNVSLERLYGATSPSALIARDRRIYVKGLLQLGGNIHRPNPELDWNGSPAGWPAEFGTIIQGDRVQLAGGIEYRLHAVPEPNPGQGNLTALLAPYAYPWGTKPKYHPQFGPGYAIITKDLQKATDLESQVKTGSPVPQTQASVSKEIYPIALFSGNPPLEAWSATDSGGYFNNPDRYSIFNYAYAGLNNYGVRADYTCFAKDGANQKHCSNSEDFPNGFANWRRNAGLEGVLFTKDAEEIPAPKMSWDNLEALEEDAKQCGIVISNPTNTYSDCDIWDQRFVTKYASQGAGLACSSTSRINLDSIGLSNFNVADLSDPSKKDRLLRRIVYLKVPSEIAQTDARGLMMSALPNNIPRKNLSLWIVSEDTLALRGFQQDLTSPLNSDPQRLREVAFNQDISTPVPAAQKASLPLVILSPEQIHLLSPQYQPLTPSRLHQMWPSSSGKIHPINHNLTDTRYEDDGFKYGYRKFILNNIGIITGSNVSATKPFYLRGLWSGPDSSADQLPSNLCMINTGGYTLEPSSTSQPFVITAKIPPYHSMANSPIPPKGSNYYGGNNNDFPRIYYPEVFWKQRGLTSSREESEVYFTGIRIHLSFDSATPPGKRDISSPSHLGSESRYTDYNAFDLSHKTYTWDSPSYYQGVPQGTSCMPSNMAYRVPSSPTDLFDIRAATPSVNNGRYIFIQSSPALNYRDVGSIVGVEQPILEAQSN
ncbi:hypothetical protein [Bdellovibrio sp. BCCA]|uniref:hypothetical protein n=1 Tax=Bdellovibrio sp. BCCA TaxID=3136281 RepID=UPI0030F2041B